MRKSSPLTKAKREIEQLKCQLKQSEIIRSSIHVQRDAIREELARNINAAKALPFRQVTVLVNDDKGRSISQSVLMLNAGDTASAEIDCDGYVYANVKRS